MISVLTDSRGLDTYYANPRYGRRVYGYNRTFPFLLRRDFLGRNPPIADLCHIPDHFRGGTVQNNIIRLALTDPQIVVLLDGIWETLLNKQDFHEWVSGTIDAHEWKSGAPLDLSFSSERIADLYLAGELPKSPETYARRMGEIVSYFRRRRRQCVWLTTPVTPRDHLGGVHYAGDYLTFPDWGRCVASLNEAVATRVTALGGQVIDLNDLMETSGGAEDCLLDQWHFTPSFHAIVAEKLSRTLGDLVDHDLSAPGPASSAFMLPAPPGDTEIALIGPADLTSGWRAEHPDANVVITSEDLSDAIARAPLVLAILTDGDEQWAAIQRMLKILKRDQIIVFPEELEPMNNPSSAAARH